MNESLIQVTKRTTWGYKHNTVDLLGCKPWQTNVSTLSLTLMIAKIASLLGCPMAIKLPLKGFHLNMLIRSPQGVKDDSEKFGLVKV